MTEKNDVWPIINSENYLTHLQIAWKRDMELTLQLDKLKQQILDAEETIKELSAGIGYKEEIAKKYWNKHGKE
jgi:hypothetical protein